MPEGREQLRERFSRWSPPVRIAVFVLFSTLTSLFGAVMGAAIAWVWLSLQHELPLTSIPPKDRFVVSSAVICASYPTLSLLTFAFMRRTSHRSLEWFGLVKGNWFVDLTLGGFIGIAFVAVMFGIYALTGLVKFEPVSKVSWGRWLVMSFLLCPLIGLTEELVFRGYLLSVAEEWKGRWFAIVFTSVLFWLVHLGQGNVHEFFGAVGMLTLGLTFALARYLTGGLWLPIGLHAGYNWMALSLGGDVGLGFPSLTHFQPNVPSWLVGPSGHVGVLDLAFYILLLLCVAFLLPKVCRKSSP